MKNLAQLLQDLNNLGNRDQKVHRLRGYFESTNPEDAMWTLYFLNGNKIKNLPSRDQLLSWISEFCKQPRWLAEECLNHVGKLAEALTCLMESSPLRKEDSEYSPLHRFMDSVVLDLGNWQESIQKQIIRDQWSSLNREVAFLFNTLLSGEYRSTDDKSTLARALAETAGVSEMTMLQRLTGKALPNSEYYQQIMTAGDEQKSKIHPYPFCSASLRENHQTDLAGELCEWTFEWEYGGVRCQLIKRGSEIGLWSKDGLFLSEKFPEILRAAARIPNGTVLDGELLVWSPDKKHPDGYSSLQKRLRRKVPSPGMQQKLPVLFMAFDQLEQDGEDIRQKSLDHRKSILHKLLNTLPSGTSIRNTPVFFPEDLNAVKALRDQAKQGGFEGIALKKRNSTYQSGRINDDWWLWKSEPCRINAVLIYARKGKGNAIAAQLFTEFTLAVWQNGTLVAVARSDSGLSDDSIRMVDRFIRENTVKKFGPVSIVKPQLVFELAFDGVLVSSRHKSGLALKNPRILRWRRDMNLREAARIEALESLFENQSTTAKE